MAGQPKAPFYVVLALVVVGLVAFAIYRADIFAPERQEPKQSSKIDPGQLGQARPEGRVARHAAAGHHGQGIHLQAGRAAAGDQGHVGLQADGEQHGAVCPERLGRLGTDHPGQRRLQARQGLEDARRQGIPRRTGADRRPGRDDRGLCRRPGPHRLGHARHGAAVRRRHGRSRPASRRTAASCRASSSRSTGRTAATASWSAKTSRPWPTCATRRSCWRRTRPRSTSR